MSTPRRSTGPSGFPRPSTAVGSSSDSVSGHGSSGAHGCGTEGSGSRTSSASGTSRSPEPRAAAPRPSSPGAGAGEAPGGLAAHGSPEGLAALLCARAPSCGPVRLVAVDGHAGSGKTTFAARLSGALGGAPVLHLDDLASHETFFGWVPRLTEQVLRPLSQGRTAHYTPYDWHRARFPSGTDSAAPLPPAPVVLVEGVGAGRRALRPHLACLLWMDMAAEDSWRRGRLRDGPGLAGFWDTWTRAEMTHFAQDSSYSFANFVVRRGELGYEVRKGPAGGR